MKLKSLFFPSLLALGVAAAARGQEIKFPGTTPPPAAEPATPPAAAATPAAPAATPAAPAATFTEAQVLETIGWFMGRNSQSETFEFTPQQIEAVTRGFTAALSGKGSPCDLKQIGAQVQAFVTVKQDAYIAKLKQKTQAIADGANFDELLRLVDSGKFTFDDISGLCAFRTRHAEILPLLTAL